MDVNLGNTPELNAERDAIHIAVVPLVADQNLSPGDPIRLKSKGIYRAVIATSEVVAIGIVDPFLDKNTSIRAGQRFWALLKPNTITGLKHQWQHPQFESSDTSHEQWLRDFADKWGLDFNAFTEDIDSVVAYGVDLDSPRDLGDDYDKFWHHLEGYTGKVFSDEQKNNVTWSCSC